MQFLKCKKLSAVINLLPISSGYFYCTKFDLLFQAIQSTKTLESPAGCPPPPPDPWVPRPSSTPSTTPPPLHLKDESESEGEEDDEDEGLEEEEEEVGEERVPTPEIMKREEEELDTDQVKATMHSYASKGD